MPEVSSLAISADGQLLAVGDGPELLTYMASGQPVWKHFCEGILISVDYSAGNLVTVDTEGRVTFFRAPDGRVLQEVQLEGVIKGSFVSPDGLYAVVTSSGVVVVQPTGETFGYPADDLSSASYGPDRNSLGLGSSNGNFVAMDGTNGTVWGTLNVGAPITGVAWNPRGFWMFTAGNLLYSCDGGASEITGQVDVEAPALQVGITLDGAVATVLTPPGKIALVELHKNRVAGHIVVRREVHAIAMAGAKIGLGLDDGDASTVDLISRNTVRTEPHPGRGRNNWNLDLSYDTSVLAGAITNLRAGGQAIAEAQYGYDDDQMGGRGGGCGLGCLAMNVLWLTCAGFIGLAFLVNYVRYM